MVGLSVELQKHSGDFLATSTRVGLTKTRSMNSSIGVASSRSVIMLLKLLFSVYLVVRGHVVVFVLSFGVSTYFAAFCSFGINLCSFCDCFIVV